MNLLSKILPLCFLAVLPAMAGIVTPIDNLLLGTGDANGNNKSFTNLNNVQAQTLTLGTNTITNWPSGSGGTNSVNGITGAVAVTNADGTLSTVTSGSQISFSAAALGAAVSNLVALTGVATTNFILTTSNNVSTNILSANLHGTLPYAIFNYAGSGTGTVLSNTGAALVWATSPTGGGVATNAVANNNGVATNLTATGFTTYTNSVTSTHYIQNGSGQSDDTLVQFSGATAWEPAWSANTWLLYDLSGATPIAVTNNQGGVAFVGTVYAGGGVVTAGKTGLTNTGGFVGNGPLLSNLNAAQLSSGVIPLARLSTTSANAGFLPTTDGTNLIWTNVLNVAISNLTVLGGNNITNNLPGALPMLTTNDGSSLTNLQSSSLVGTISPANLPAAAVTNGQTGVTLSGTFSGFLASQTNIGLPDYRLDFPYSDLMRAPETPPFGFCTWAMYGLWDNANPLYTTNGNAQTLFEKDFTNNFVVTRAQNLGITYMEIDQIFTNQNGFGVAQINTNRFTNIVHSINLVQTNGFQCWTWMQFNFGGGSLNDCTLDTGGDPSTCLDGYANPWQVLQSNAQMITSYGFDGIRYQMHNSSPGTNWLLGMEYQNYFAYWLHIYSETNGHPMTIILDGFSTAPAQIPAIGNYVNAFRPDLTVGTGDNDGKWHGLTNHVQTLMAANNFVSPYHYLEWFSIDIQGCSEGTNGETNVPYYNLAAAAMTGALMNCGPSFPLTGYNGCGIPDSLPLLTNGVFRQIQGDPAMIPSSWVSNLCFTTASGSNFWTIAKPIGGYNTGNIAVLFLNSDATAANVTFSLTNFGNISTNLAYVYDIWHKTNITTLTGSASYTLSVPATNAVWVKISNATNSTYFSYTSLLFPGNNNATIGFGSNCLSSLTSALIGTAFGQSCMSHLTTGNNNTAMGQQSLEFNSSGQNNSAFGVDALQGQSHDNSTAFGFQALGQATNNNNTALGYDAGYNLVTGTNNIYIGNQGNTTESGMIYIGTSGVQTNTTIAGIINGNGTGLTNLPNGDNTSFWVSTNGSDSNIGTNSSFPFLSLTNALAKANATGTPCLIYLGKGTNIIPDLTTISNHMVIGTGSSTCYLLSPQVGAYSVSLTGSNTGLAGVTILTTNVGLSICIHPQNITNGLLLDVADTTNAAYGLFCHTTPFITLPSSLTCRNCTFYGTNAGVVTDAHAAGTNSVFRFYNCLFSSTALAGAASVPNQGFLNYSILDVEHYGCVFSATNLAGSAAYDYQTGANSVTVNTSNYFGAGCTFLTPYSSAGTGTNAACVYISTQSASVPQVQFYGPAPTNIVNVNGSVYYDTVAVNPVGNGAGLTNIPWTSFILPSETANTFFAGPTSGSAATATWRGLSVNDFNSGSGASSSTYLRGDLTWASVTAASAYNQSQFDTNGSSQIEIKSNALLTNPVIYNPTYITTGLPDYTNNLGFWLDANTMAGTSDGTTVTTWTGWTNQFTNSSSTAVFSNSVIHGHPAVHFYANANCLVSTNTMGTAYTNSVTIFAVVRHPAATATAPDSLGVLLSSEGQGFYMGGRTAFNNFNFRASGLNPTTYACANPMLGGQEGVTNLIGIDVMRFDGTNLMIGDGLHFYTYPMLGHFPQLTESTLGRIILGGYGLPSSSTLEFSGDVGEIRFYHEVVSLSNITVIANQLFNKWSMPTNPAPLICENGDSIAAGTTGGTLMPISSLITSNCPIPVSTLNYGVVGATISNVLSGLATTETTLRAPGQQAVELLWGGRNDMMNYQTSPAITASNNFYIAQTLRDLGWKVIIVDMLPTVQEYTNTFYYRTNYNSILYGSFPPYADAVVRASQLAPFNNNTCTNSAANGGWMYDGVHPLAGGYYAVSSEVLTALNRIGFFYHP